MEERKESTRTDIPVLMKNSQTSKQTSEEHYHSMKQILGQSQDYENDFDGDSKSVSEANEGDHDPTAEFHNSDQIPDL
jgi:hypothetical protein